MMALLSAFGLVFVAEAGDKSMLMALTLSARYRWSWVLAAVTIETVVIMALAVLAGGAADAVLPERALAVGSGLLFVAFGVWTLLERGDEEGIEGTDGRPALIVIGALALTMGLSELGDKTQIAALSLSGMNPSDRFAVWLGATAGMVAADAIAIAAGGRLVRLVPRVMIARAAGLIFILFGAVALFLAFR